MFEPYFCVCSIKKMFIVMKRTYHEIYRHNHDLGYSSRGVKHSLTVAQPSPTSTSIALLPAKGKLCHQ